MEQTFNDSIPLIKSNPDGSWPPSAKYRAPRYELPSGTDLVSAEYNLKLGERPGPGRVAITALMSGPVGGAKPIGALVIGGGDQWLITGHGGSEDRKDIQEDGPKRVIAKFSRSYFITLSWQKNSAIIYTIYENQTKERMIHQISINSSLNLDIGGRIINFQDVKNPKKLKDFFHLPPFGSTISGLITASDMDAEEPDDGDDEGDDNVNINEPVPVNPLPIQPPIIIPPPTTQPPISSPPIFDSPIDPRFPLPNPFPPPILPPTNIPSSDQNSGFNFDAFPAFVSAAIAFYPELGKSLGQIAPYIQAIQTGKKLADGNFNPTNPNDFFAVLQLIALFRNLK